MESRTCRPAPRCWNSAPVLPMSRALPRTCGWRTGQPYLSCVSGAACLTTTRRSTRKCCATCNNQTLRRAGACSLHGESIRRRERKQRQCRNSNEARKERDAMSTNPTDPRRQYPSTYFADRSNQDEMTRLIVQDRLVTAAMGGVLPEQPDPTNFPRMLDVGCGTGGWLIEAAKTYPTMTRPVGVDVNTRMIQYAREQAKIAQVDDRVDFQVMDALLILEFPKDYFDLTNMR